MNQDLSNLRVVFQPSGAPVAIVTPYAGCGLNIKEIGARAVPRGLPFWVINESDIPRDEALRFALVLDTQSLGNPAGMGEVDHVQN